MKSFYSQQILGTLAILGLWLAAIAILGNSQPTPPSHVRLAVKQVSPELQAKIVTEPRDPQTGELSRTHHKDGYGMERKTEVSFVDQAKAVVEYSVFGKPSRVTETKKDGSSQVFHLDPMGRRLLRAESLRPDGTLKTSVQAANGKLERRIFAEDGKTLKCRQSIGSDGSLQSDIFAEDGKTLQAQYTLDAPPASTAQPGEYQPPQPVNAKLKVFDKSGKLLREETISQTNDDECGGECGSSHYQETVSVKVFWENGKVRYEQEWQAYPGSDASLQSATEFDENGKKLQTLISCYEKAGKEHASQRLDKFDNEGKLVRSQFIGSNRKLLMEKTVDGKTEVVSYPTKGELVDLPLMTAPSYKALPQEFFNAQLEANRLQQVLSE